MVTSGMGGLYGGCMRHASGRGRSLHARGESGGRARVETSRRSFTTTPTAGGGVRVLYLRDYLANPDMRTRRESMAIKHTVQHATIVVERSLRATPARVFAAWADPGERRQWDVPGDGSWVVTEQEHDFRVGGRERSRFGPAGDPAYLSDGIYLDIVPGERIITAGTMHDRDARATATLCTLEVYPAGSGTRLGLTDPSAVFRR